MFVLLTFQEIFPFFSILLSCLLLLDVPAFQPHAVRHSCQVSFDIFFSR
jgi:hypothetical protein